MKKICSWILTLVFLMSMTVIPAYAEGEEMPTALAAPTDLVWNGTTAAWTAVENASGYSLQLYKDRNLMGEAVVVEETEYDLGASVNETAAYYFEVTAVGDGELYSNSEAAKSDELEWVTKGDIKFQTGKSNSYVTSPSIQDTALRTSTGRYYWTEGQGWVMSVGKNGSEQYRIIMKADVSALNNKVNVKDATLKLQVRTAATADMILDIYSITDADGDWKVNSTGDAAKGAACPAQKARHANSFGANTKRYFRAADDDGTGEVFTVSNTNHKDFGQYLKNKNQYNMYSDAAGTALVAWADNDGVDWTGGFMLGNPGEGSYEETPFDTVTVKKGSTLPIEITIPNELLRKWIAGQNNGIIIRAREDNCNTGVSIYASNTHNTYQPAGSGTMPALIVHTTDKQADGAYLSYDMTDSDDGSKLINATVYNCFARDITPAVVAAVYGTDKTMKQVVAVSDKTIVKMTGEESYELKVAAGEDDTVKIMLLNSLDGLKPYNSAKLVGEAAVSTNASKDFNASVNALAPGEWSYYDCYGSDAEKIKMLRLLNSDGTETNKSNAWYVDYKKKPNNWKINAESLVGDRYIACVYTIGEEMAGKTITIEGTYTAGTNAAKLAVCRSTDLDPNSIDTYPEILQLVPGKDVTGTDFKIVITPDKAVYGNDIIFSTKNTCSIESFTISAK